MTFVENFCARVLACVETCGVGGGNDLIIGCLRIIEGGLEGLVHSFVSVGTIIIYV